MSGGIDSATAVALASAAIGPENVFALLLPYKDWHAEASKRARLLLSHLKIPPGNILEVDITPIVEAFLESVSLQLRAGENNTAQADLDTLRAGNIMARVRMVILFDYEASDIEPLRNLYKTELYQLAEFLKLPQEIREAVPTAGLWSGQTDEGQFGFTYQEADEILYGLYEVGLSPQELAAQGMDSKVIEAVQAWVKNMAFKHNLPLIAP